MSENWTKLIQPRISLKARARNTARSGILSLRSFLNRERDNKFIRCLYSHYVFDDQRSDFERQIKALKNLGDFINTADALSMIDGRVPISGRYFHLSYDDGLHCLLRNAAPILDRHQVPSLVFVNSALAGTPSSDVVDEWCEATDYPHELTYMSWEGMKAIQGAGMEIGAHTRTHRRLSEISSDPNLLEQEIVGCKNEIEAALQTRCEYFAWPFGTLADVDDASIEMIQKAGYLASFGVYRQKIVPGATDIFRIPRHHFEPQWPIDHILYFAQGGMETMPEISSDRSS